MSRDYWTIYDDDTMIFEKELDQEDAIDMSLWMLLQHATRTDKSPTSEKIDYFEKESDLFEVE